MMKGVVDVERVMLPKGISVRSNEYVKVMSQAGASHHGRTWGPTRSGNASQLSKAKVYVQEGKKEEGPLELEVNNQGMFKTEFCNKW